MREKRAPWNSRCVPHRETLEQRLARYVPTEPDPITGCILWTGPKRGGYGVLTITDWARPYRERRGGGAKLAHRLAWERANGTIPPGAFICHHCDTPACVRIEHLFLGDALANTRDMIAKGRQFRGPNWVPKEPHIPIVVIDLGAR